jgi:hypothetical protein
VCVNTVLYYTLVFVDLLIPWLPCTSFANVQTCVGFLAGQFNEAQG